MAKERRQPKPHIAGRNEPEPESHHDAYVEQIITRVGGLWRQHIVANARLITVAILAVVVVMLGMNLYRQNQTFAKARAWGTVETSEQDEVLLDVAETHANKTVGQMAAFRRARLAYSEGNYQDALARFDAFLARFAKSALSNDARLGRAYCLESLARYEDAANAFGQLAASAKTQIVAAQAYLGAGRCHAKADQPEKARQAFENAKAAAADSMFAETAMEFLHELDEQG